LFRLQIYQCVQYLLKDQQGQDSFRSKAKDFRFKDLAPEAKAKDLASEAKAKDTPAGLEAKAVASRTPSLHILEVLENKLNNNNNNNKELYKHTHLEKIKYRLQSQ